MMREPRDRHLNWYDPRLWWGIHGQGNSWWATFTSAVPAARRRDRARRDK